MSVAKSKPRHFMADNTLRNLCNRLLSGDSDQEVNNVTCRKCKALLKKGVRELPKRKGT